MKYNLLDTPPPTAARSTVVGGGGGRRTCENKFKKGVKRKRAKEFLPYTRGCRDGGGNRSCASVKALNRRWWWRSLLAAAVASS